MRTATCREPSPLAAIPVPPPARRGRLRPPRPVPAGRRGPARRNRGRRLLHQDDHGERDQSVLRAVGYQRDQHRCGTRDGRAEDRDERREEREHRQRQRQRHPEQEQRGADPDRVHGRHDHDAVRVPAEVRHPARPARSMRSLTRSEVRATSHAHIASPSRRKKNSRTTASSIAASTSVTLVIPAYGLGSAPRIPRANWAARSSICRSSTPAARRKPATAVTASTAHLGFAGSAAGDHSDASPLPRGTHRGPTAGVRARHTDNWIELSARFVVPVREARAVKDRVTRTVLDRLAEASIPIASATQEVTVRPADSAEDG